MGCMQTQPSVSNKNLYQRYADAGLVMPAYDETENDFERQLFFAMNMLRNKPKSFIPAVQRAYSNCTALKTSKAQKDIIKALKESETLPLVQFNDDANKAVRENNKAIVEKNESLEPLKAKPSAGNIEKYKEIVGSDQAVKCAEASQYHYTGNDAEEFVVIMLAEFFDKKNAPKTQPKDAKKDTKAAAPAPTDKQDDAAAADAEKKDDAAAADADAAKTGDAAAVNADPSKNEISNADAITISPILDAEATQIGISNKAHTAALNSLQFLWIYKKTNAMI